ncbi:MAG: serine/threonine-protein kinase [Scrofimicrobium sp.]
MSNGSVPQARGIRAGRTLGGRYTLVSRIAKGGMGEVWRVRDQRTGMMVAAKVLRPELRGEVISLSRLRLEASNTLRARHPNIAAVLDSGEDEGQGWIVMELIDGHPLTDYVGDGKRLSAGQLIPILAQSAYALDASAAAGVVHRDIKPANIMIRPDGVVKLTDFGISFAEGQANLTAVGMVMGTAQYLAPEQALGEDATSLGDLYALGVIAYEALAGRRPFTGKSAVEIAMSHVKDEVPALPSDVPELMQQVVYDLLAKKPEDRPQSGAALIRTLTRVASELNATTSPVPLPPLTQKTDEGAPAVTPTQAPRMAPGQKKASEFVTKLPPAPTPAGPVSHQWHPVTGVVMGEPPAPSVRGTRVVRHSEDNSSDSHGQDQDSPISSRVGMWLIGALVILTVILILIAMVRGHGSVDVALELRAAQAVSSTEVQTWLIPALGC